MCNQPRHPDAVGLQVVYKKARRARGYIHVEQKSDPGIIAFVFGESSGFAGSVPKCLPPGCFRIIGGWGGWFWCGAGK